MTTFAAITVRELETVTGGMVVPPKLPTLPKPFDVLNQPTTRPGKSGEPEPIVDPRLTLPLA